MRVLALIAAFVSVLLIALFVTVRPTPGTVERLGTREVVEGIEVPTIGTVGDFPDPGHRHVVNVTADGRISVAGKSPSTYGELVDALRELSKLSDGEKLPGTDKCLSGESFVIRADAATAWRNTVKVSGACAEAMADRIFFAVRHDGDGAEGAVAAFLPRDVDCPGPGDVAQRLAIVPGEGGTEPAAAYAKVREVAKSVQGRVVVVIDAAGEVTTGTVLAWFDAALRGGAASNGFAFGATFPTRADPFPKSGAAATSRVSVRWGSDVFGERGPEGFTPDAGVALGAATVLMPPVGRVLGAFAGQSESFPPSHH